MLLAALLALAAGGREALPSGVDFQDDWAARGAAAGDVDGDGTPDLVLGQAYLTTGPQRGRAVLFQGDPAVPGRYASRVELDCGPNPADLILRDFDGNLLPDVVTASAFEGTVSVLLQTAPGVFGRTDYAAVDRAKSFAAGDLDGDGLDDLAVAGTQGLAVLLQDALAPGTFLPAVPIPTTREPDCVAVGDVDGDALQDLLFGVDREVVYLLQSAAVPGTFGPEASLPVSGKRLARIVAGDLDGDGRDDFAVAARGIYPLFERAGVFVLLHVPGGGLAFTEERVSTGVPRTGLVAIDMDGDALPDLVAAGAKQLNWHRQDPAAPGTFKNVKGGNRTLDAAEGPLAVADYDGDALPDPMVSYFHPHLVTRKAAKPDRFANPKKYRPSN